MQGDNTIMMIQSSRYLISSYREAKRGVQQPPGVGYLNRSRSRASAVQTREDLGNLAHLVEIFDVVCANLVANAGEQFEGLVSGGMDAEVAYEECGASGGHLRGSTC